MIRQIWSCAPHDLTHPRRDLSRNPTDIMFTMTAFIRSTAFWRLVVWRMAPLAFFFSFIDTTCFCLCPATTNLFTGEAIRPNRRSRSALIITRLQHDRTRRQDRLEIGGTRTNIVRDLLEAISRTTFLQIY